MKISCAGLAQLEIRARLEAPVMPVVDGCAVDEHLLSERVAAEWIPTPQHDVCHLAALERTGLLCDPERTRGIRGDPGDCLGTRDRDSCACAGAHGDGRFLVEPLNERRVI